jgi:hypothetical protein
VVPRELLTKTSHFLSITTHDPEKSVSYLSAAVTCTVHSSGAARMVGVGAEVGVGGMLGVGGTLDAVEHADMTLHKTATRATTPTRTSPERAVGFWPTVGVRVIVMNAVQKMIGRGTAIFRGATRDRQTAGEWLRALCCRSPWL